MTREQGKPDPYPGENFDNDGPPSPPAEKSGNPFESTSVMGPRLRLSRTKVPHDGHHAPGTPRQELTMRTILGWADYYTEIEKELYRVRGGRVDCFLPCAPHVFVNAGIRRR